MIRRPTLNLVNRLARVSNRAPRVWASRRGFADVTAEAEAAAESYKPVELPQAEVGAPAPEYMSVTFCTPNNTILEDEAVRLMTIPGSIGAFGLSPDHVPILCEMQPGIVSLFYDKGEASGRQAHYFVAGGFCISHPNSVVEVTTAEAVEMKDLDPANITNGLNEALNKLGSSEKMTELEKA